MILIFSIKYFEFLLYGYYTFIISIEYLDNIQGKLLLQISLNKLLFNSISNYIYHAISRNVA